MRNHSTVQSRRRVRVHSPNAQVFCRSLSAVSRRHLLLIDEVFARTCFGFPGSAAPTTTVLNRRWGGLFSPGKLPRPLSYSTAPSRERGNHAARHHPNRTAAAIGSCNGNLLARITSDAPGPRHRTCYQRGSSLFTTAPCVSREGDVVDATDVDSAPLPSVVPRSVRVLTAGGLRSARFKETRLCFSCRRPCPPPGQALC